jgi:hypothetical protein
MAGAVGRLLLLLSLLAAAGLCACGGEDGAAAEQETPLAVPWLDPDGEFPVVGSLAVNPADAKLWMATNTGLFLVRTAARRHRQALGRRRPQLDRVPRAAPLGRVRPPGNR